MVKMRYTIGLNVTGYFFAEVEADSIEEAEKKVEAELNSPKNG